MDLRFDHAVVVVTDLAAAMTEFRATGFTVAPGGRHDVLPTENALVVLADGGYLELLALTDGEARESLALRSARPGWEAELRRAPAISRRFWPRLAGAAGVADVVWRGGDLDRFATESRRRGFPMTGPVAMARVRADGTRLAWRLVLPVADRLPFLIEDVTPRSWRVPEDAAVTTHGNGARGVAAVTVRAGSVPATALEYADLFGARLMARPDGGTVVELGGTAIRLIEGAPERAVAIELTGVTALTPAIERLGIHRARDHESP